MPLIAKLLTKKWVVPALWLVWMIGLLLLSWSADYFLPYKPSFPYFDTLLQEYNLPRWLYSWANFDGVHYLTIIKHGYIGTGLIQAFFPVYPGLVAVLTIITGNALLTGIAISALFSILSLQMLRTLLKPELGDSGTLLLVVVMLTFPTAFFLTAVYTEALFLWLVLACFMAARKKYWWVAGILAAIASGTRLVGVLLVPSLLIELLHQVVEANPKLEWSEIIKKTLTTQIKSLAAISLGVVGLGLYMMFLYGEFKDPLYFLHVQSEFGGGRQENLVLYPQVVWRYVKILLTYQAWDWRYLSFIQEAVAGVVGLGLILYSFTKTRVSYSTFALLAFLLPTVTGTFSSMPRYILVCFPIFIVITQVIQTRRWLIWLYLIGSILLLMINTVLFIQGYWVA